MNGLALCAGVGGLELGLRLADPRARVVCYVEREAFSAANLVARMEDSAVDRAPICDDITTFDGHPWRGCVDIVTAGFPCQPFSCAGKQRGIEDERWLWPDIDRILGEVRPRYVFLENVPGLFVRGIGHVLGSLAELGYDAEWGVFSAAGVGATQLRRRVFILAYSNNRGWEYSPINDGERSKQPDITGRCVRDEPFRCETMAHPRRDHEQAGRPNGAQEEASEGGKGLEHGCTELADTDDRGQSWERISSLLNGERETHRDYIDGRYGAFPPGPQGDWTEIQPHLEPAVCGLANGVPYRVDRLRALGNGVVPLVAAHAFRTLAARIAMTTT